MTATARRTTVVVAPDSFKGSLPAQQAAAALAEGARRAGGEAVCVAAYPMADGGEGTLDALLSAWGTEPRTVDTTDALGRPCRARYGVSPDGRTGVVELAEASGLPRVADLPPAPRDATTVGTGVVARAVLDAGVEAVLVCLGGSATTDGGTGILTALGVRFLDEHGRDVRSGGAGLADIASVDVSGLHHRAREVAWRLAVDVTNPLTGPSGAAAVYGPQKGATPDDVRALDAGLDHLATVLERGAAEVRELQGAGAAGGVPAGLVALLGATLVPGALMVAEAGGLDVALAHADLVITGEGRLDQQSVSGKVVGTVAALADLAGARGGRRPCVVVVAGQVALSTQELAAHGVDAAFSLADGPAELERLVTDAGPLLTDLATHAVRLFVAGRRSVGSGPAG